MVMRNGFRVTQSELKKTGAFVLGSCFCWIDTLSFLNCIYHSQARNCKLVFKSILTMSQGALFYYTHWVKFFDYRILQKHRMFIF